MVTIPTSPPESHARHSRAGVVTTVRLADAAGTVARRRAGEIRTANEIESIRDAALVARASVSAAIAAAVVGATPESLAAIVEGIVAAERAESAIRGVVLGQGLPFPSACCVGVNDRFVNAVPGREPLQDGDVVTVDVAVRFRGWCADVADCTVVGRGTARRHAMVEGCHEMLHAAMATMAPGVRWSRVAQAMQQVASDRSLGLVTTVAGHGVGRSLHERPAAPCGVDRALLDIEDFTLLPGMVLAVEPTVVAHADGVSTLDADGFALSVALVRCEDGWSMRTVSGRPGCSVERTIVVTPQGCERLDEARASVASVNPLTR